MKNIKTILLLITLIIFGNINAAIIYTDIADGQPAGIDFNQDGNWEFEIMDNMGIGDGLNYWANANNNIYAIDAANWDVPEDLLLNATIDAGGNWEGFGDAAVVGWGGPVDFAIDVDRYLGMMFDLGGNIYYGWVRVEVIQNGLDPWGDPAYEVIYKDYAYNDVADAAILAGEMPVAGNIDVTGITVSGQGGATTLGEGSTLQMLAAILPANATDQTVTWSVTNGTGTATISTSGLLSGLTQGTVTVIATANDGSGIVGDMQVTITVPQNILIQNLTILTPNGQDVVTDVNGTLQMIVTIYPGNATNQTITWEVIDQTGSATISATGILTAVSNGTVLVRATANDGSGLTAEKVITINMSEDVNGLDQLDEVMMEVYPNPFVNQLTINSTSDGLVTIVDLSGKTVYTGITENQTLLVDLSHLENGIYMILIESNNNFYTQKVIKK